MSSQSLQSADDMRAFLQQEFLRRLKKNPRYSMRSFALALGLNSGTLSQLMAGKRPLGTKTLRKLALQLGMNPDLIQAKQALARVASSKAGQVQDLEPDRFDVISEWEHFAILELFELETFRFDPSWMARKLALPRGSVVVALDRLKRTGLIEQKDGAWKPTYKNLSTLNQESTRAALKKLQRTVLQQAQDALEVVPVELRDQSTLTVAMPVEMMPELKTLITQFRRKVNAMLTSSKGKDAVYQLSISLFPVTMKTENEK